MRRTWIRAGVRLLILLLLVLVALWLLFPVMNAIDSAAPSELRAECDKQFFSSGSVAQQLEAGGEDEFLIAYIEPELSGTRPGGGVLVRAQPQFGFDTSNTPPGTAWQDVTVTVVRHVSPLRSEPECLKIAASFVEGRYEAYCRFSPRFTERDNGQSTYRIFVRNESNVPIEFCFISDCDGSSGGGSLCRSKGATNALAPQEPPLAQGYPPAQGYPQAVPSDGPPTAESTTAPASPDKSTTTPPAPPIPPPTPTVAPPVRQPPAEPKPPLPELDEPVG